MKMKNGCIEGQGWNVVGFMMVLGGLVGALIVELFHVIEGYYE